MIDRDVSVLKSGLDELKISYDDHMIEQTEIFYDMLVVKNKVMNLTTITDHEDFIIKHILDSLLSVRFYSFKDQKLIDVGTGAGFPGIPLKIFFPELDVTLIDSVNKKLDFINTVISELGLDNIRTIHGRAEDLAKENSCREKFDVGVSRAVANLSVLAELGIPFIKTDGKFIFYKAGESDEEISAAENAFAILGAGEKHIYKDRLFDTDIVRKFIIVDKNKECPGKYPRKAGVPSKQPLQ